MTKIYFKDNHVLEHQWVAMNNPESETFAEVSAVLRISVAVQGAGDK